ncbi:MAG: heme exporter protein C [Sphingobacteriales bacterium]|jgi:heme exporter protein C
MKFTWWKIAAVILVGYSVIVGFLGDVPRLAILNETIRNLYFHVPMWFAMIIILLISVIGSIKYLANEDPKNDYLAVESVNVGVVFGILGLATGMVWAKFTWGEYWSNDPKQNASAIAMLLYLAYLVLRNSIDEEQKRAKISAVFNVFAFPIFICLIFILPRMTDSLHPGNGGNPGFSGYDLDSRMRMVFYPAVLGWILIGYWIVNLRTRVRLIESQEFIDK